MKMNNKYTGLEIAVIGVSGRFPGAKNVNEFWKNLINGEESIGFLDEDELLEKGLNLEMINDEKYVNAVSTIDNPECFDTSFFNYLPQEARLMDPQTRIYHECVWEALEDAGCDPEKFSGRIGLFAGAAENFAWRAYTLMTGAKSGVHSFASSQYSDRDFLSTLISYKLNLKGPALSIHTACSTSLVAIHMAARSLLTGECEVALAGGISFTSHIKNGYQYEEGMINSPDGHCRAFDEDAKGTIGAEGAGVVVLKKLKDALKDKDNIYAVIKGSAVNNDGYRKVGYTSPSVEGQVECIKLAHKFSHVNADTISYVEAHGTGTVLGDPIEVNALNLAFNNNTKKKCGLGSVKTNIGHLNTAAGVAGFIKVVLALKNKQIPKSLNYKAANKNIAFEKGPFHVVTELTNWDDISPLRAGVSSFGIGGTNAHIVLEEAPEKQIQDHDLPFNIFTLSAKNEESLDNLMTKFEKYFERHSESSTNVAYTLNMGRKHFPVRKLFISSKDDSLKEVFNKGGSNKFRSNICSGEYMPLVFMFSGQGTQYVNMAKDLYDSYSSFRDRMDEGFEILNNVSNGKDFKDILFCKEDDKAESLISETENTQPLLFLVEYCLAACYIDLGIKPQYVLGHSLGEIAAACISGVFSFADGLKLCYHRGRLMNSMTAGSMISIAANQQDIEPYINKHINLAAVNSENQCVLSGTDAEIEALSEKLNKDNVVHKVLNTSHAFHSSMMTPMIEEFETICKELKFSDPKIKFISNLTGKEILPEELKNYKYWSNQILSPVQFFECVNSLFSDDKRKICLEIGPGNTLLNLANQHQKSSKLIAAKINSLPGKGKKGNSHKIFVTSIGNLWMQGQEIKWEAYYEKIKPYKVSLPTYSFLKNQFPAIVNPFADMDMGVADVHVEEYQNQAGPKLKRNVLLSDYVPPETPTEIELAKHWEEFFGVEKVGINDDFFELGGDSLKAMNMINWIFKKNNVKILLADFMEKANVKMIAEEIDMALQLKKISREINSDDRNELII